MADGFYSNLGPDYQVQLTPRESVEHEWDVEATRVAYEHEITVARLNVEAKKKLFMLQREDANKSRKHAERMKETELAIRELEVKWKSLLRIPVLVVKLPILALFAIAYIMSVMTNHEIKSDAFWRFVN